MIKENPFLNKSAYNFTAQAECFLEKLKVGESKVFILENKIEHAREIIRYAAKKLNLKIETKKNNKGDLYIKLIGQ